MTSFWLEVVCRGNRQRRIINADSLEIDISLATKFALAECHIESATIGQGYNGELRYLTEETLKSMEYLRCNLSEASWETQPQDAH